MAHSSVAPVLGAACSVLGLLFLGLALATDHWLTYTVDRPRLQASLALNPDQAIKTFLETDCTAFTRNRGMFRTCFPDTPSFLELPQYEDQVTDAVCLVERGYQLWGREPDTLPYGQDFMRRAHLMRAQFALLVAALLLGVLAVLGTSAACVRTSDRGLRWAGLLAFLSGFLGAAAAACFHGVDYLEKNTLNFPPFRAHFMNNAPLKNYVAAHYGWTYICAWLGVGLQLISSAILLVVAARFERELRKMESEERRAVLAAERSYGNSVIMAAQQQQQQSNLGYLDYPTIGGPGSAMVYDPQWDAAAYGYKQAMPALEYPAGSGLGLVKY